MSGMSANVYDEMIIQLLKLIQPKRVLDIGPGQGKYAALMAQAELNAYTVALEIDPTYVDQFDLRNKYSEVRIGDAGDLPYLPEARNELFDCVLIGDCIEHMPKSRGLDLLNFLTYRTGYIIVVAPEFSYYDTAANNFAHTESHISVWSEFDFQWHDRFAYMRSEIMQIFILRGYQPSSIALDQAVGAINANPPRLKLLSGEDLKPAHLELRTRARTEFLNGHSYAYRQM